MAYVSAAGWLAGWLVGVGCLAQNPASNNSTLVGAVKRTCCWACTEEYELVRIVQAKRRAVEGQKKNELSIQR
jgi:hypothetical protein